MRLVLSLFSGVGALDEGFRREGYCVVSAGDVAWSSLFDVRQFRPPLGVFEGVIGGDPCQSHSALANLVRAKGLEPSFPDMTPELCRVVEEARPRWFLRENVPKAPEIKPAGYDVANFLLDNWASLGEEQSRRRRFWFGVWGGPVPELRKHIQFAFRPPDEFALTVDAGHDKLDGAERIAQRRHTVQGGHDETLGNRIAAKRQAVCADPRRVPVAIGGSGKVKRSATSCDGRKGHREGRKQTVSGRHSSNGMGGTPGETPGNHAGSPPRYSLEEMLDLQGLPRDLFGHSPLTMQGKRKFVGNAVTLPMACALARAVRMAMVE